MIISRKYASVIWNKRCIFIFLLFNFVCKNILACLFSIYNTINLSRHEQVCLIRLRIFPLNMCDIIIYAARWWGKHLSKRSLIKHTCSWYDKLIVLWILNRQAKVFLHISKHIMVKPFLAKIRKLEKTMIKYSSYANNLQFSQQDSTERPTTKK